MNTKRYWEHFRKTLAMGLCWLLAGGLVAQPLGERIVTPAVLPADAIYPQVLMLKLRPGATPPASWQRVGEGWRTGHAGLDAVLRKAGAVRIDSLFAPVLYAARADENCLAEQQMQQTGLLRWYRLHVGSAVPITEICAALRSLPMIETAEPVARLQLYDTPNDTRFAEQWSLQNTGQTNGLVGADIKAVPAWDIQRGSKQVIVAINDGGVLSTHADLQANMWSEKNFNFVTNSPTLTPDDHGTHVAGLLGAVRNNAKGIAGVAGGDGTATSGVTMMSLQITGGTSVQPGSEALAFVYAANNGAAISQNSWGYTVADIFPSYTADAIDYFIQYGGGAVLKGGLVVFAAGNSASSQRFYPAAYSRVLAVAASNHQDVRANYSNFGTHLDLTAPGGEADVPMLSTVANGGYGSLFGTSMAAPLVSGVAALVLSHVPGRLLVDDLRNLLLYTADDIYPLNPTLVGQLGTGRLNAWRALRRADSLKAQPVLASMDQCQLTVGCSTVQISTGPLPAGADEVLIAEAEGADFIGLPFARTYSVGDVLPGGGRIVYRGAAGQVELPLPMDGSRRRYRLWAAKADGGAYSTGRDAVLTIPHTVQQPTAAPTASSIVLSWQRQCPQRGVLLAFSTDGRFGTPTGDPAAVSVISGGGTALQAGTQTSFVHNGLSPDTRYFYAFYAYQQVGADWHYSEPLLLAAATSCVEQNLPVSESFTDSAFPPAGWRLIDGGPDGDALPDGRTWRRLQLVGSRPGDNISVLLNAYTQNGNNSKEVLRMPAFTVSGNDSLVLSFDYAYRAYDNDPDLADSLELAWTDDCGASFTSIWKAGGEALATVPGFSTVEFVPVNTSQWKTMRFQLKSLLPANRPVALAFIGTNKFGQNLWLDNVELRYEAATNDAALTASPAPPAGWWCQGAVVPKVRVAQVQNDTLRSIRLRWQVNNTEDSVDYYGLLVPPGRDTVLAVKPLNLPPGQHLLQVLLRLPNGRPDTNAANDTLQATLQVVGDAALPLTTGFENGLPTGWVALATTNGWAPASAGHRSIGSLRVDRFSNPVAAGSAMLVSPVLTSTAVADSLLISFSVAHAPTTAGTDTLRLWASTNCGASRQLLAEWAGDALSTAPLQNNTDFVPTAQQWRRLRADASSLLPALGADGVQLQWQLSQAFGNNVYLDDIQVNTVQIPPALRRAGFGVYPNPFAGSITVWHLQPPTDLRYVQLVSAGGQVLQQIGWAGSGPQTVQLSTAHLPAGMYLLRLGYANRTVVRKLIKY
jgi:subtilisin family serine protease